MVKRRESGDPHIRDARGSLYLSSCQLPQLRTPTIQQSLRGFDIPIKDTANGERELSFHHIEWLDIRHTVDMDLLHETSHFDVEEDTRRRPATTLIIGKIPQ